MLLSLKQRRAAAGSQYALVVGLIAVVALLAVTSLGSGVNLLLGNVANRLAGSGSNVTSTPAPPPVGILSGGSLTLNQLSSTGECGAAVFTNSSANPVSGFSVPVVSGSYQIGSCGATTCTGTLAGSATCSVFIQGNLSGAGAMTGSVQLTASSGGTATVSVTGTGAPNAVAAFGLNTSAQLGIPSATSVTLSPVAVTGIGGSGFLNNFDKVSAGGDFSCGTVSGAVYCWGANASGQLGTGNTTASQVPVQVVGVGGSGTLSGITAISGQYTHNCGMNSSGAVFCWGENTYGGNGNNTTAAIQSSPTQVVGVGGTGFLTGMTQISTGAYHACAMSSSGVWCWGYNLYGQLGNNATATAQSTPVQMVSTSGSGSFPTPTSIAAGIISTCVSGSGGGVWCIGYNANGELGRNFAAGGSYSIPVAVVGVGGTGSLSGITGLAGSGHFCGFNASGNVFCWGSGTFGELGNNASSNSSIPVAVVGVGGSGVISGVTKIALSNNHGCAGTTSALYCWGHNNVGQVGAGDTAASAAPRQVLGIGGSGTLGQIKEITAGGGHMVVAR